MRFVPHWNIINALFRTNFFGFCLDTLDKSIFLVYNGQYY